MELKERQPHTLAYASAARSKRPPRNVGAAITAALGFFSGIVIATWAVVEHVVANAERYPDVDTPNITAGSILDVLYGVPVLFLIVLLWRTRRRVSVVGSGAKGLIGGVIYTLTPSALFLGDMHPGPTAGIAFLLLFPLVIAALTVMDGYD